MTLLQGLGRLSQFDDRGFEAFDANRRGFWRSFAAALFCLPVWFWAQYQQVSTLDAARVPHVLMTQVIAYVVAWLAYPLLMVRVADFFAVWPNYYRYMVAYNWFRIVLQFIWLPLLVIKLEPAHQTAMYMIAVLVEMIYDWFLARRGLKVAGTTAAALALIDFLLGLLIDQIAYASAG